MIRILTLVLLMFFERNIACPQPLAAMLTKTAIMKMSIKFMFLLLVNICNAQSEKVRIITSDIENFWITFDKIKETNDTVRQYEILDKYYIQKGTSGLADLMEVRNYTPKEYIDAINNYPKFWHSIRKNTTSIDTLLPQIRANINKLELIYPELKPATLYFAIGVFRTNGTINGTNILIGSEVALADSQTVVDELPRWRQPFYKENDQIQSIGLLAVHEYIHTLQKELVQNLLSMCLYEGIAEFISCKATGQPSTVPAIKYGKEHNKKIIDVFVEDLFLIRNNYNWLWGENANKLKVRDLGYYIGYEIAERYYNTSPDKLAAIKDLIELNYTNEQEIERIVDEVKMLPKPLAQLYEEFEKGRPTVVGIEPFKNKSKNISPGRKRVTINFSEPLDGFHTGVDFGPMGKAHFPDIGPERKWSEDRKSWTIEVDLKPNMQYQILIDNNFRKENGVPLKTYLIEIQTEN